MSKVLMLATTAAMIEQFNKNNILLLNEMGYSVDVAGNFVKGNPISDKRIDEFKEWIEEHGGAYYHIPADRNPLKMKQNIDAYHMVVELILQNNYQFIHVHTPIGSVIGRYAARKTKTPIIYTAHGFHFYKGAPLQNWVLFYPIEKHCSRFTDCLVTINKEDYAFAKKKMHADEIEYVPGIGIDLEEFDSDKITDETKELLRKKLCLSQNDKLLLSVGELNQNKNHRIVIEALPQVLSKYPNVHYVIAGKGSLQEELQKLSKDLGIEKHVHLLGFCANIREWYATADYFVFPSYREGLSVSLMEAMANGLPCAVSQIRGNVDLIDEGLGGLYFDPSSRVSVEKAMISLLKLEENQVKRYNLEKIQSFNKEKISEMMKGIYSRICVKKNQ